MCIRDRLIGIGYRVTDASAGQITVDIGEFAQVSSTGTYTADGTAWQNGWSWFAVKIPGQVQVAYPTAAKWQEKLLASDVSGAADGDVSGLSFTGLTVGKTYRVTLQARIQVDSGTNTFRLSYYDQSGGAGNIIARYNYDELESANQVKTASVTAIFTAQTSNLYLRRESTSTNDTISGNSSRGESFATLEQLDTHTETTEW